MVIFFDIDGTLVDNETQILPKSAVQAIDALRKNGHTPIINTGRPYSHIDPRVRQLPFSGWVCAGGMEVYLEGQWLQQKRLGTQLSQEVIEAVRACRMQVIYEVEGGFLLDGDRSTNDRVILESGRMEAHGCFAKQINDFPEPNIIKFVTFDEPKSHHEAFVEKMSAYFHCIERGKTMVEYVMKGCSKGGGMRLLLDAIGAKQADTFAFGDSTNDIAMFRAAGHGICMGDGMEEAKAAAEYVTDTVLNDGIAKALRHYGLI